MNIPYYKKCLYNLNLSSVYEYKLYYKSYSCPFGEDCKLKDCYYYHNDEEKLNPVCKFHYNSNSRCDEKKCRFSHVNTLPYLDSLTMELVLEIVDEKNNSKRNEREHTYARKRKRSRSRSREIEYSKRKRSNSPSSLNRNERLFTKEELIQEINYANSIKEQTINQLLQENNMLKQGIQEYKKIVDKIQIDHINNLLQNQYKQQQTNQQPQQQTQYLSSLLNEITKAISK
jgi:hypothetical protein